MPIYPTKVEITEVAPRDGLQNEPRSVATKTKLELIRHLFGTGLTQVEVTSLVSPDAIPQLADADRLLGLLTREELARSSVLVANMRGLERATATGVTRIAVFTAASQTFNQRNIRCGIEDSLERFAPLLAAAKTAGLGIRGYISCAFGCPYEGQIDPSQVFDVACRLDEMGCDQIALSDTIGIATPLQSQQLVETVMARLPVEHLAVHFHDTRGQALANIFACLQMGVTHIDASVAGLGGCPHTPGAAGNVSTEDLVYLLDGMEIETGVDLQSLVAAGEFICSRLGRRNQSRVARTMGDGSIGRDNRTASVVVDGCG